MCFDKFCVAITQQIFWYPKAGLESDSDSEDESGVNEYRELLASKLVDGKISAEDHTSLEDLREKLMMPIASRDYVLAEVQASTGASITTYLEVADSAE
jgi:hypothetical protein